MFYTCCQIPRLIRIAITEWIYGKHNSLSIQHITLNFEVTSRHYYKDTYAKIRGFSATESALMACSVHWPVCNYLLEDTSKRPINCNLPNFRGEIFNVQELVDAAIIFPYRINADEAECSYVMPTVIWDSAQMSNMPKVSVWWESTKSILDELVPGMNWSHLHQNFTSSWHSAINLTVLGNIYEDLITSSLAAKYRLWKITHPEQTTNKIALQHIYKLGPKVQGRQLVLSISVDLSKGVLHPHQEATLQNSTANVVCVNRNCPTARHDAILDSDPGCTVLQLKHSLTATPAQDVKLQVEGVARLLWFHIGRDEDIVRPPKKHKVAEVQLAIQEGRLAFLSGTGCASPLMIDYLILMKKLV